MTEPFYPLTDKTFEFDCTDAGPDGYLDLTLKFRAQDVLSAIEQQNNGKLTQGDVLTIEMNASTLADNSPASALYGEDIVRINSRR